MTDLHSLPHLEFNPQAGATPDPAEPSPALSGEVAALLAQHGLAATYRDYLLHLGDTALILSQRLSEWCGHAPILEEDLALTNLALDLLGQARLLLAHAGQVLPGADGVAESEDQLAFLRREGAYRNVTLVELPNGGVGGGAGGGRGQGDFARTVLRNLFVAAWQLPLWEALSQAADPVLAAIAAKSRKEARYHLEHAADWVIRLGDGTEESHARMAAALTDLWPYTAELFAPDAGEAALAPLGLAVTGDTLRGPWLATVAAVGEAAGLTMPPGDGALETPFRSRGRFGQHSEHLGHLLAEMQYLQRAYPGCQW